MHMITVTTVVVAVLFLTLQRWILEIATDDNNVLAVSAQIVPAMLVGTYLNLIVGNITSGVFSGMGRPLIATILSFGFELPMSVGGVAIYVFCFHAPTLLGVTWWQAIAGGLEAVVVLVIMSRCNWEQCAVEAQERQEAPSAGDDDDDDDEAQEIVTVANTSDNSCSSGNDDDEEEEETGNDVLPGDPETM